jgi:hypothetical protein
LAVQKQQLLKIDIANVAAQRFEQQQRLALPFKKYRRWPTHAHTLAFSQTAMQAF